MKALSWAAVVCALLKFVSQTTEGCTGGGSSGVGLVSLAVSCKLQVDLETPGVSGKGE